MIKPIPAVCEEQKEELEKEINHQKLRLANATQKATEKFQQALSVENWIRDYPFPSVALMALGGFLAANLFYEDTAATPPQTTEPELPTL